ncbi:Lipopolysaccharide biosynthesis protein, LPS:glycosyltransferase [Paracoccus aminovorans]|uniref:Lipopolysaccharide biosynthesis protein, LPS:glycosyltransferase n=1 Tax=Paracoccus aminovorans TaxID=34004 RepID=A0A1I2X366_9RHOB|nr:glycosyltransferase family 8 protein [Paracoccus aminovorans]CQR85478.1 lipopolysaccharide biosynthesis glycosyltransferase [Paracoccus aminovorans]SFH07983.1 Lipopolysaccharide biosynthesis protein, LPS:glycosyltransferase [Paracoccus aminovorans]
MHIVTGSDDNYVPGVMVLIASTLWHNPGAHFTILDMGISRENRARIDLLGERLGAIIHRIEVAEDRFNNLFIRRAHLKRSAYLRLLIPELLPDSDRVIYMDCDMVVTGRLEALDQVPLEAYPIAAVACPSPDPRELAATETKLGEYVNSGLLVMNLPLWRNENIAEACERALSDPSCPRLCEDQSAINIVCRGRVKLLDPCYNIYANEPTYMSPESLPKKITVLHYVVNVKPWMWNVSFGEIWDFHADRISDLLPPRRRKNFFQLATRIESHRRMVFGLAMGRKKHWQRLKVRRAIRENIVLPYLQAQKERPTE